MKIKIMQPLVLGTGKAFEAGVSAELDKKTAITLIASNLAIPDPTNKKENASSKKTFERRVR